MAEVERVLRARVDRSNVVHSVVGIVVWQVDFHLQIYWWRRRRWRRRRQVAEVAWAEATAEARVEATA